MDLLLCWSKERSRMMASALHAWLPTVLPKVKPWMSEIDIDKGKEWSHELSGFLDIAKAVIVNITPENVRSPWIYYECGRVSGRSSGALICPYLLEDNPSILSDGPLGKMQQTKADKEDSFRLLRSLNNSLADRRSEDSVLGINFERTWPELAGSLNRIRQLEVATNTAAIHIQTEAELLAGGELSSDARSLLLEIGQDRHGCLMTYGTNMGDHFQTNGKELNDVGNPRTTAKYRSALTQLVRRGLVTVKGKSYEMTAKGYEVFDLLSRKA